MTKATMHIQHKPGDAIQADWAGDTLPVYDPVTGEQSPAYLTWLLSSAAEMDSGSTGCCAVLAALERSGF